MRVGEGTKRYIKILRVLPELFYIRAASTAGFDYGLEIFRGGKMEMINRYIVFERR